MHELNLLNEKREMNEAKIKRHAIFCVSRQVNCQHVSSRTKRPCLSKASREENDGENTKGEKGILCRGEKLFYSRAACICSTLRICKFGKR